MKCWLTNEGKKKQNKRKKNVYIKHRIRTRTPHYNLKSQICDIFSLICRIYFVRSVVFFFSAVVLYFRACETLAHISDANVRTELMPSARKHAQSHIHTLTFVFAFM